MRPRADAIKYLGQECPAGFMPGQVIMPRYAPYGRLYLAAAARSVGARQARRSRVEMMVTERMALDLSCHVHPPAMPTSHVIVTMFMPSAICMPAVHAMPCSSTPTRPSRLVHHHVRLQDKHAKVAM